MKEKTAVRPLSALHLLHRAGQCADELFALNVGKTELTPRQYAVLAAAAASEDLSQTALVDATGIDRSTLADIVALLSVACSLAAAPKLTPACMPSS
jgi:DNA-binding MarR family transcriptional regulator